MNRLPADALTDSAMAWLLAPCTATDESRRHSQALVITADRQSPGLEQAQKAYAGNKDPAELLKQLKAAEAAGKPTTELRRAFFEAVKSYRGGE